MKKLDKTAVNSLFNSIQFNSIPKIVSLIVLLFSISCKSKYASTEEGIIPKEYSGKYISFDNNSYNYDYYYETTSSNCIIDVYGSGSRIIPIVFDSIVNDYKYPRYVYREYYKNYGDWCEFFTFFTNDKSIRQLNFIDKRLRTLVSSEVVYIHEDDINK